MAKGTFDSDKPANADGFVAGDLRNNFSALHQGDLSPLRTLAQTVPDMTVQVAGALVEGYYSQVWLGNSAPLNYAGGNSPVVVAPSANPRIDLLTIDSAGTLAWTLGAEAGSPTAPDCPASKLPICYIYSKTTMDRILDYEDKDDDVTEGYIYKDVRPLLVLPSGSKSRAYRSAGQGYQVIPLNTWTTVAFGVENYDVLDEYNTATYRFTAKSSGYYCVTTALEWYTVAEGKIVEARIWKKNSSVVARRLLYCLPAQSQFNVNLMDIVYLAKDDYIEIQIHHNDNTAGDKRIMSSSEITYFAVSGLD